MRPKLLGWEAVEDPIQGLIRRLDRDVTREPARRSRDVRPKRILVAGSRFVLFQRDLHQHLEISEGKLFGINGHIAPMSDTVSLKTGRVQISLAPDVSKQQILLLNRFLEVAIEILKFAKAQLFSLF